MRSFRIVPLSEAYAHTIRQRMTDDFGHDVITQLSPGYGPCRVSLQPFVPGQDMRLLFSHSPFDIENAFNQPGPVVIHLREVEAYSDVYRFPPAIKADKENFPLSLIGYNRQQHMVYTRLVGDDDVEDLIDLVFATKPEVAYLHARNAEAQCFICMIERA